MRWAELASLVYSAARVQCQKLDMLHEAEITVNAYVYVICTHILYLHIMCACHGMPACETLSSARCQFLRPCFNRQVGILGHHRGHRKPFLVFKTGSAA